MTMFTKVALTHLFAAGAFLAFLTPAQAQQPTVGPASPFAPALTIATPAGTQQPGERPALAYVSLSEELVHPNALVTPFYRVYLTNWSSRTITATVRRRGYSQLGNWFFGPGTRVTILPGAREEVARKPYIPTVREFYEIISAEYSS
jgi:hypothetical protein